MDLLNNFYQLPKPVRAFIEDYSRKIDYLNEAYVYYENDRYNNRTFIMNADLWIEVYIPHFPQLKEFREHVKRLMAEKNIEPYPDYYYEPENNHFKILKRPYEELVEALKKMDNE